MQLGNHRRTIKRVNCGVLVSVYVEWQFDIGVYGTLYVAVRLHSECRSTRGLIGWNVPVIKDICGDTMHVNTGSDMLEYGKLSLRIPCYQTWHVFENTSLSGPHTSTSSYNFLHCFFSCTYWNDCLWMNAGVNNTASLEQFMNKWFIYYDKSKRLVFKQNVRREHATNISRYTFRIVTILSTQLYLPHTVHVWTQFARKPWKPHTPPLRYNGSLFTSDCFFCFRHYVCCQVGLICILSLEGNLETTRQ